MSKDAYYFPHDSNARHDPKIIAMTTVYGMEGYGWYWVIVEMLREQEGYSYSFDSKYAMNSMARELNTDVDKCKAFIDDCIKEFDLFEMTDNQLSCPSLDKRMNRLDRRREQAKAAAEARWNKDKPSKPNKKGDSKKDKPVDPSKVKTKEVLTNGKYWALFLNQLRHHEEFGHLPIEYVENEKNKMIDWTKSKGRVYKDWKAAFKNWLRNAQEYSKPKEEFSKSDPSMNNPYKIV